MTKWIMRLVVATLFFACGCTSVDEREAQKWRVTLDRKDKRPYGAYIAYESLKYYFPGAGIITLNRNQRFTNFSARANSSKSLLVLEGIDFYLSDEEWAALKDFIREGNEVMLFCNSLDHKIEQDIGFTLVSRELNPPVQQGTDNQNILTLTDDSEASYGYRGRSLWAFLYPTPSGSDSLDTLADSNYVKGVGYVHDSDVADSAYVQEYDYPQQEPGEEGPSLLGKSGGKIDFIRFAMGEGHLTVHAAPLVLSNYFLLQDSNEQYLAGVWNTLPKGITEVYWNDYSGRYRSSGSRFAILLSIPQTRLALFLALLVALVYILFEGKRKQRIVPVIAPIRNDSVSFAETVGRLYYNKGNHSNLQEKMVQQFLEWVRNNYMLNTSMLNENFVQQLTIRSGMPEATVKALAEMIGEVRASTSATDDAYLYQLYTSIQQFYTKHPN